MSSKEIDEYNKKLSRIELSSRNIEYYARKAIEQTKIYDSTFDINSPRRIEALAYIVFLN